MRCLSSMAHVGYKKRMSFYLGLFVYYSVQLALYRKGVNSGAINDAELNKDYLVAVDALLLVQALVALSCGWIFRPAFETLAVFFDAILFGLTFGWLILAAPNASEHKAYYVINGSVVIFLMIVDVSALLYVRPEVISVAVSTNNMANSAKPPKALRVSGFLPSYGKIRNRFLAMEEGGPMADKAEEEGGHEFESLSSPHPIDRFAIEDDQILGNYKIDTSDKNICEGFRVNMGNLPPMDGGATPRDLTWDHFVQIQHIVDSSSCHIYTALWEEQPVVLKLIKADRVASAVAVAEFEAEEGVLSRIRHPNIVRFLGSGKLPRKFLVLELLSGGSLSHTLGLRADSQNQTWVKRFTFHETLQLALSLARALNYLHHDWSSAVHIIHRDIKPDNIGFAANGQLKLFDFGLCAAVRAQREKTEQYRLTGNTGTLRYMAPEVVLGRSYHQSVDVYSFGILIWQVASGKVPFRDMGKKTYFDRVVVGGQRPRIDPRWPASFTSLLRLCWHEDKHMRPSFATVVQELESLMRHEEQILLAKRSRLHRRCLRSCLWALFKLRPVLLLLLFVVFICSLLVVIAYDDTVIGAVLGATSSFGIYAILMSYLRVWPSMVTSSPDGTLAAAANAAQMKRRKREFRTNSLDVAGIAEHTQASHPGNGSNQNSNGNSINSSLSNNNSDGQGGSGVEMGRLPLPPSVSSRGGSTPPRAHTGVGGGLLSTPGGSTSNGSSRKRTNSRTSTPNKTTTAAGTTTTRSAGYQPLQTPQVSYEESGDVHQQRLPQQLQQQQRGARYQEQPERAAMMVMTGYPGGGRSSGVGYEDDDDAYLYREEQRPMTRVSRTAGTNKYVGQESSGGGSSPRFNPLVSGLSSLSNRLTQRHTATTASNAASAASNGGGSSGLGNTVTIV